MKILLTLFFALLFVGSSPLDQIEDDLVLVRALRLDDDLAEVFRQVKYLPAFTIDRDNILRPQRNYQLVFSRSVKQFLLVPQAVKEVTSIANDNYEKVDLDDGVTIHCYCADGNDDCSFDNVGGGEFKCSGSCSCGVAVTIQPGKYIHEYQSPEGNWFPTKNL